MDRPVTQSECRMTHDALMGALRELRSDLRSDLREQLEPIRMHLEALNGRTRKNEVSIAVLQTQARTMSGLIGGAAGVGAALAVEWFVRFVR